MVSKKEILEELGFSKNEAKVYIALLDLGHAPAGKISDNCGVHRTNVYDALDRLKEKGLVSFILKGETKFFEATDPKNLMHVLKEKETKLKLILPQLLLSQKLATSKGEAHIYEGLRAAKNMMNHMLESGKPIYVYGVAKEAPALIGPFLSNYHDRRMKKKVQFDHIYNTDAIERVKWLNKLPYTRAKLLPKEFDSPVATNICGDEVILIMWQKNTIVIQIKNEQIANAYKKYFDLLWSLAEYPNEE